MAPTVSGDFHVEWGGERISQVITNLVHNALVHGHDPILVEPRDEGEHVSITVRNPGEIPSDMPPRLFDAFTTDSSEKAEGDLDSDFTSSNRLHRRTAAKSSRSPMVA